MSLQDNTTLAALAALAIAGVVTHDGVDYLGKTEDFVNGPLIYGIIILFHSVFGATGITEKPAIIEKMTSLTVSKFFILLLLAFAAVRDFEDTILLVVLFLATTQLLRNKEERKRHPYILA